MQALQGLPITIYGAGDQTRSFCYVQDLIDGLVRLMDTEDSVTGPINLGRPEEFTIRQLADQVMTLTKSTSRLERHPMPIDDPTRRRPDISKARSVLGWEPTTSLHIGLTATIEYFRTLQGRAYVNGSTHP